MMQTSLEGAYVIECIVILWDPWSLTVKKTSIQINEISR